MTIKKDNFNIFRDENISIFHLLYVIRNRWKVVAFFMVLSLLFSTVYYLKGREIYKSNSVIVVGKRSKIISLNFLDSPVVMAQVIRAKYESRTGVENILISTRPTSFFEYEKRTIKISIESFSPYEAQKLLVTIINDIKKEHERKYLNDKNIEEIYSKKQNKFVDEALRAVKTKVILEPTLPEKPVRIINYMVFIHSLVLSFLLGSFSVLIIENISKLKRNLS